MYCIHRYAQFGCGALAASIQVSAQPVAPSLGTVDPMENLSAFSALSWYGQPAPTVTLPFLKSKISSEASAQYFLTSGRCWASSATAAWNCGWVSSYGSAMPSSGLVALRYSAASAIWMGLSGTVTLPLYLASYRTLHDFGAAGKALVLYMRTFGPHCRETP